MKQLYNIRMLKADATYWQKIGVLAEDVTVGGVTTTAAEAVLAYGIAQSGAGCSMEYCNRVGFVEYDLT